MNRIFSKWAKNIFKHSKLYIAIIGALTVIFGIGLSRIQMKMGNDVFVSPKSAIYKNTQTYQKNFGGDAAYVMLSGKQKRIISHNTMQKVATFSKNASKIKNVKSTTSVVSLLNDLIQKSDFSTMMSQSDSASNEKLQKDLFANLSDKQKNELQKNLQSSLSKAQLAKVQAYTQSLLTTPQQAKIGELVQAGTNQNQALQETLTAKQNQQLQAYTLSLLTSKQRNIIVAKVVKMLPSVEKMSTPLLRDIMLDNNGKVRKEFDQLLPKNGKNLLIMVNTTDKTSDMSTNVQLRQDLKKALKNTHFNSAYEVNLAGQPIIMGEIKTSVMSTMVKMVIIAVILMIAVLTILFAVRRRLFSLFFVLIGMIWTFGIMGWLNIPITLATMATLPIIIGLGTDFGVQFHNRYEEEFRKEQISDQASQTAAKNIGPAVGTAVIMMALSFLTMLLSKAPMMQQFGITLAIGVVCLLSRIYSYLCCLTSFRY
ncbi:MMPL family transporter [Lactobacillus sp. PV037]|uniref:MMPL family transporter n=1 Tax=Lactobacillus sp. PV037 TaxID=2594496 RepID=UPI00223FB650|nr:MMPL family transporter [Lactobacillus sp. PV037]QNQ84333.1 MMPL family transporter [Lactobacillus sp. PV037]